MKPVTGRNGSFVKVLEILEQTYNHPITIVETGCIRNVTEESKFGDGWSTLNWDYYAKQTGSKVYVVDIDENHLNQSKKIVPPSEYVDSLNEVKAAWDKLNDRCFILIDDVFNDQWAGKGELSIPYLLENGFTVSYYTDSQVLLQR